MEIAPGIHRLEPYAGDKLVAHHLIVGDRALLIDAGTPDLAAQASIPWLREVLGDLARLDMILVTHADVDHFGGLAALKAACPHALVLAPARDRRWIEHPAAIFAERYDAYHHDHGLTYEPAVTDILHAWQGPPVTVDVGLSGGEDVRCGDDLLFQVVHVPGHTPGHLMLWQARRRLAIIGDALNGATQLDRHGAWTAPPPYTDRDLYLASIQTVRALEPAILLTGHYPVMRDDQIAAFVDASRDFVMRTDEALARLLREASGPLTLQELIQRADPLLGPFAFPPDLAFALEAHMRRLEATGQVIRVARGDDAVAWQAG